jgi:hypothetical protein
MRHLYALAHAVAFFLGFVPSFLAALFLGGVP